MTDKSSKRRKFELPTINEQQQLNNSTHILQQSFYNLQFQELLSEVKPPKKFSGNAFRSKLDSLIESIRNTTVSDSTLDSRWLKESGIVGLQLENHANPTKLDFQKPTSVELIGSFSTQSTSNPFCNIDIAVTMPSDCFLERDILNHVYFDKRKLYLGAICYHFQQNPDSLGFANGELGFSLFKGDHRKPILIFKPTISGFDRPLEIRIYPIIESSVFKIVQLLPSKSNVRTKTWLKKLQSQQSTGKQSQLDESSLLPTPRYNASILEDMCFLTHHRILSQITAPSSSSSTSSSSTPTTSETSSSSSSPENLYRDLLILFKIWLTQRSLRFGFDSIDSHTAGMLLAYLIQTRRIHTHLSLFGAFQILLKFLSETSFESLDLSFSSSDMQPRGEMTSSLEDGVSGEGEGEGDLVIRSQGALSLLHPVGSKMKFLLHNCLWRVSTSSLWALRAEASQSLELIHSSSSVSSSSSSSSSLSLDSLGVIRKLFLERYEMVLRYDTFYQFQVKLQLPPLSPISTPSNGSETSTTSSKKKGKKNNKKQQQEQEQIDPEDLIPSTDRNIDEEEVFDLKEQLLWSLAAERAEDVLRKGLTDRVKEVRVCVLSNNSSPHSSFFHQSSFSEGSLVIRTEEDEEEGDSQGLSSIEEERVTITIGFVLDELTASRKVDRFDKQPISSLPNIHSQTIATLLAASSSTSSPSSLSSDEIFRLFWGPKSSLRRFQDGAIVNAVVWETPKTGGRSVVESIVRYLLGYYLTSTCGENGEKVLTFPLMSTEILGTEEGTGTGEGDSSATLSLGVGMSVSDPLFSEYSSSAMRACDELKKILLTLDASSKDKNNKHHEYDFPLSIEILPADPDLRYTSPAYPPIPHPFIPDSDLTIEENDNEEDDASSGKKQQKKNKKHSSSSSSSASSSQWKPSGETLSLLVKPITLLGKLNGSMSSWPQEERASEGTKLALLLKLSEILKKKYRVHSLIHKGLLFSSISSSSSSSSTVDQEETDVSVAHSTNKSHLSSISDSLSSEPFFPCLDIFHAGRVFRLSLLCDFDSFRIKSQGVFTLTNQPVSSSDLISSGTEVRIKSKEHATSESVYQFSLLTRSCSHHQSLRSLLSQFPSLPVALRMFRRWLGSQGLSGYLDQDSMELLLISVYLDPYPKSSSPSSPSSAFFLVLQRLISFDWSESPLIVDCTRSTLDDEEDDGDDDNEGKKSEGKKRSQLKGKDGKRPLSSKGLALVEAVTRYRSSALSAFSTYRSTHSLSSSSSQMPMILIPILNEHINIDSAYQSTTPTTTTTSTSTPASSSPSGSLSSSGLFFSIPIHPVSSSLGSSEFSLLRSAASKYLTSYLSSSPFQWDSTPYLPSSSSFSSSSSSLSSSSSSSSASYLSRCNVILLLNQHIIRTVPSTYSPLSSQQQSISLLSPKFSSKQYFANESPSLSTLLSSLIIKDGSSPHPIQFQLINNLRKKFGHLALFLFNEYAGIDDSEEDEGRRIGIIWKPSAFLPIKKMAVLESGLKLPLSSTSASSASASVSVQSVLNVPEIMSLILSECEGLVTDFIVN